jgi:hypothetical protein
MNCETGFSRTSVSGCACRSVVIRGELAIGAHLRSLHPGSEYVLDSSMGRKDPRCRPRPHGARRLYGTRLKANGLLAIRT